MPSTNTAYLPTPLLRLRNIQYYRSVSPYAPATECPALTWCIYLRPSYGMSGTDRGYRATSIFLQRGKKFPKMKRAGKAGACVCLSLRPGDSTREEGR
eukprot:167189-Rhodomonas_salina.2